MFVFAFQKGRAFRQQDVGTNGGLVEHTVQYKSIMEKTGTPFHKKKKTSPCAQLLSSRPRHVQQVYLAVNGE